MKVIALSLKNSLMLNLLTLFILIVGVYCSLEIRREAFPSINYDYVTVTTVYPGADPKSVEEYVTNLIEDELNKIDGIEEFRSRSKENVSSLFVKLSSDLSDEEKSRTITDIQRAVDSINKFPKEIKDSPRVNEIKSGSVPVVEVVLSGKMPYATLHQIAEDLTEIIERLPDANSPRQYGVFEKEYWIEVNPKKIEAYNVTLDQIIASLSKENVDLPAGKIETESGSYLIRTVTDIKNVSDIENITIRSNDADVAIKVKDLAKVSIQFESNNIVYRASSKQAISLIVRKSVAGDIISLIDETKEKVSQYKKQHQLDDLKVSYVNDFSLIVRNRLGVLLNNGSLGLILVLFSMLLLISKGIAFVAVLGMPVAFLGAITVMYALGLTINLLTMFALILVLGILVDDAIIVSENIWHHYEKGESPWQATIKGTSEVFWPVTITILTTIAAFSPMLLVSGIFGKYISLFPKIVIVSLVISLIEALFILPSHAFEMMTFIDKRKKKRFSSNKKSRFKSLLKKILNRYRSLLAFVLRFRYLFVFSFVLLFIGSLWFAKNKMRFVLFPAEGIEVFYLKATFPEESTLESTTKNMSFFEDLVKDNLRKNELIDYVTWVGLHQDNVMDPIRSEGTHLSQIGVYLTPEKERDRDANEIIEQLRSAIETKKNDHQATMVSFKRMRPGPPIGKPVAIRIKGDDLDQLASVSKIVEDKLRLTEGVRDIGSDYILGKKELKIILDLEKTNQLLLNATDVSKSVRQRFEGQIATYIYKDSERIPVRVKYEKNRDDLSTILSNTYLRNAKNFVIPLSSIADIQEKKSLNAIKHLDGKRLVTVGAFIDENVTTSIEVNSKVMSELAEIKERYPNISFEAGGEFQETQDSLRDLRQAFLVALFLIFILVVALFKSLTQPFIIMLTIPFGLMGVVFAFYLHGLPLSFLGMLGAIGLTGVVVNDSILMVDFINKNRKIGMLPELAILQGAVRRFRPVCLTSITTIAGILPLAYGIGGEDKFLKPAAVALGYGLLFATVLILLLVPAIYYISEDIVAYFKHPFSDSQAEENS